MEMDGNEGNNSRNSNKRKRDAIGSPGSSSSSMDANATTSSASVGLKEMPGFMSQIIGQNKKEKDAKKEIKSEKHSSSSLPYNPYVNEKNSAETTWLPEQRLVVVNKMRGSYWRYMGFTHNGNDFMFPEEALILLERGQLIINKSPVENENKDAFIHPHHRRFQLMDFYDIVMTTCVPLQCYLTYVKLKGLQYIARRHVQEKLICIESESQLYELHKKFPNHKLLDIAVSFDIYPNSRTMSKRKIAESKANSYVIVVTCSHTFSSKLLFRLLDEADGVPLLFAYVSETGNVILEEFADAFIALDLNNRGATIGHAPANAEEIIASISVEGGAMGNGNVDDANVVEASAGTVVTDGCEQQLQERENEKVATHDEDEEEADDEDKEEAGEEEDDA